MYRPKLPVALILASTRSDTEPVQKIFYRHLTFVEILLANGPLDKNVKVIYRDFDSLEPAVKDRKIDTVNVNSMIEIPSIFSFPNSHFKFVSFIIIKLSSTVVHCIFKVITYIFHS